MDGSGESETAARQQAGVFVSRALPPTNVDKYLQIRMKNQQRLAGIVGKVSFHNDEACTVPHGATAGREDSNRLIVPPIMDDVAHNIGVAAFGHSFEEIPTDERTAVAHSCVVHELPGFLNDGRQIEEGAAQLRGCARG
jgi:hypothetical protein